MIGFFDPLLMIITLPAMLLMFWAQHRVHSSFKKGMEIPARLSGAAAARHILDTAGLHDVDIEETQGHLSDHYDPSSRVIRLSSQVYRSNSAAAVGIAAHEAGHALQHAFHYTPLIIRNIAVPAAQFGPIAFMILVILGMALKMMGLIVLGVLAFGGLVVFQLVNLPVEFDASNRAKKLLTEMQIVDGQAAVAVSDVLNAAGWTYVAATLESVLTFVYYAFMLLGGRSSDES